MTEKILLIAPHPFYQERGTPIAVELLIRALSERGYAIDLLTFNEGIDVQYPGLTIYRVNPRPNIKNVMPGFSGKKILLDILIFFKFISLMSKNKYKAVHAVEESSFMATLVCPIFKTPFIYDMDSSMATQIIDKIHFLKPFEKLLRLMESIPMRRAKIVIPVCQALADEAGKYRSHGIHVLKDVSLANTTSASSDSIVNIRSKYDIAGKIFMYIGNLESYQGIDLMLEAFAIHCQRYPDARLTIIGGAHEHIGHYQNKCKQLSIRNEVIFMGKQPVAQIHQFMSQSDILLSPRTQGINTPMKVYSYLDSG
ncbi:MAG: glycosyltransferase, partial [Gammaproteobacteria bacterium]|nr:glycosyltransferase [Gammaproteobacteria bacterium]